MHRVLVRIARLIIITQFLALLSCVLSSRAVLTTIHLTRHHDVITLAGLRDVCSCLLT